MQQHCSVRLIVLALAGTLGRRFHSEQYHKHAHTYLQFCANASWVSSHACVHKVSAKWPTPAQLDPQECKEATAPYDAVGTYAPSCAGTPAGVNIYDPITIPQGLRNPASLGAYKRGADVDTMTDWDRIRCRDGQLFATGWYKKYTPQECARLCSKISNFYGSSCTHFSRQWITSNVPEHSDTCGRDGETLPADMPAHGAWGSAGTGGGKYTFRGQCIFFNSVNDHCCSTKVAWTESHSEPGNSATADASSTYCQTKYGERQDKWDSKHRSWRLLTKAYTPTEAWPVTSLGRRLSDEASGGYNGSDARVHELFFPNGSRFWAFDEEGEVASYADQVPGAEEREEREEREEGEGAFFSAAFAELAQKMEPLRSAFNQLTEMLQPLFR